MREQVRAVLVGSPSQAAAGGRPRVDLFAALVALGLLALALAAIPRSSGLPDLTPSQGGTVSHATPPLAFIPNEGQTDSRVRYYAQGSGFGFFFTDDRAVLSFRGEEQGQALQLRFVEASPDATLAPQDRGEGKVNYLSGDDPSKWRTGLPSYHQLTYERLWPGVDMAFRGAGGKLKYEFRVSKGAEPNRIRLAYAGAEALSLTAGGSLLVKTPNGTLRDSAPKAWQQVNGRKIPVESRYVLGKGAGGSHTYGFELGAYDSAHPLVIDPGIAYSTFLGSSGAEYAEAVAVDGDGSAYVTGRSDATGFPTTPGAFDSSHGSSADAFVTKLSPDGSTLEYSTYLGGTGGDLGNAITVDSSGNAYVTGETSAPDFPTTTGALDTTLNGNDDAFVTKLSADGATLAYSTYLGGTGNIDSGNGITVDDSGNAYVTGETISTNFPTTPGAFDTTAGSIYEAFVTKLDPTGSSLVYSTYLGGGGTFDHGNGIEIDGAGYAYVSGSTSSTNFPTTLGAYDRTHNGDDDAFITKLDPTGSSLAYSTFLGGNTFDGSSGIDIDAAGNAYLSGSTHSEDFPATPGAFDTTYNEDGDAFVAKLNATGTNLVYSTFLGGTGAGTTGSDYTSGIAIDSTGQAHVTGRTDSLLFPTTTDAADAVYGPVGDAFVTKLNSAGSALAYSSFLGGNSGGTGTDTGSGIALDSEGEAYVVGYTTSTNFPTTNGAYDTTHNGSNDAFVTKVGANGYARPRAATPVTVRFVPSFEECETGNAIHGAPLQTQSCAPPVPTSSYLTVGAPDANGNVAHSSGFLELKVLGESPIDPSNGDQADVQLNLSMTDIRNQGDLTDYTGELEAVVTLRITDRYNGESLNSPATVTDVPLRFAVPCAAGGPGGSTCSVLTTADSLTANTLREGKRAVWGLGAVQLFDGGVDGDADTTGDNTLFAVQGLFTP